jgi:hypothetical protein
MNVDGSTSTPPDLILRVRHIIPEYTRPDGSRNIRGLATYFNVSRTTITRYIAKIDLEDAQASQTNYTPDIDGIEETKPRVRVRAYNLSVTKDLPVRRMVAIGDLHLKPGMDVDHFRWVGRYVAETRPDNVLQIGDFFDFESCEMHSAAGSASQMQRPSFLDEVGAGEDALEAYHSEVGLGSFPHDVVYGNHENRVERLEELAPNIAGTLTLQRDQLFARYRWKTTQYRHWIFFEGVGFTHVPMSIMQKPIGGRYPENTIGNQATHSIVFGHTHRNNNVTVPKIGINNAITVTNLGSAMPHGYLPKYCDGATTGITYGIHLLRLRGGRVESDQFVSMLELAEKYG